MESKKIGVQKGTKRGPYKRSQEKKEIKEISNDGMSYQEIATIMGISPSEVKEIEQRALKKLRVPSVLNKMLKTYHKI